MFSEYEDYLDNIRIRRSSDTLRSYKKNLGDFLVYFKIHNVSTLEDISANDFRKYQNFLIESGLSNSTINTKFRNISSLYNWLHKFDYIEKYPAILKIEPLDKITKKIITLTKNEVARMINSCNGTQEKLMLTLMFYTGVRRGEVVKIKLSDIVEDKILIHGKGKRERILLLHSDVLDLIEEHLASRKSKSEFLFTAKGHKENISTAAVGYRVKKIAEKAGFSEERIKEVSCHTLRKTFATRMLDNGVPAENIQKMLGHSDITTTMTHYAKVSEEKTMDAMRSQESLS